MQALEAFSSAWASATLRTKYERHLLRIEHIGIDLKSRHSLRNRLKQIKRWVVSSDLAREKEHAVIQLENALENIENGDRLDNVLDGLQDRITKSVKGRNKSGRPLYQVYVNWAGKTVPHKVLQLEVQLKRDMPGLLNSDPEAYYQLLLERAGVI